MQETAEIPELLVQVDCPVIVRFISDSLHGESPEGIALVELREIPWENYYALRCTSDVLEEIRRLSSKYDFCKWEFEVKNIGEGKLVVLPEQEIVCKQEDPDEKNNTQLATEEPRLS